LWTVGFSYLQPMDNAYYWIVQDIIGVCMCILVLKLIHVNTIMVASVLLMLLFVYDIFYAVISPLLFGRSIMQDVATGSAGVGRTFCEKYPSESACQGALAPIPMMLAVPWFNDYRGGFSAITLGVIVLPGLLISFAARYDGAKKLVEKCNRTATDNIGQATEDDSSEPTTRSHYLVGRIQRNVFKGYFGPLMIAYALGLTIMYIFHWTMRRALPPMLILVPLCLGTTLFLGWRRRELSELWAGPRIMKKANRMVGVAGKIPEARAAAAREASNNLAVAETEMV